MLQSCMNIEKRKQLDLEEKEMSILRYVKSVYRAFYVKLTDSVNIRTYHFNNGNKETKKSSIPCLVIHGWAAGLGLFCKSYDYLAKICSDVYAIDLPGFGLSTRYKFSRESSKIDEEYTYFIRQWLDQMALEKVILIGHSFGGYLSVNFTLKYQENVGHLILVDPWGFENPYSLKTTTKKTWVTSIKRSIPSINGLSFLRLLNTKIGSYVVSKFRPDLIRNYIDIFGMDDNSIAKYIFAINSLYPSGEIAFRNLCDDYGYANLNIKQLVIDSDLKIDTTFILGRNSWIPIKYAYEIADKRIKLNKINIHIIENCGHHLYSENSNSFNELIGNVCTYFA